MKTFNKGNLTILKKDMENSLKEVAQKHNIILKIAGGSFTPEDFTLKLKGVVVIDGKAFSPEKEDFKKYASIYDLEVENLGKIFINDIGRKLEVIGLRRSSRRYPILVKDLNTHKRYKYSAKMIRLYLNKKEK